MVFLWICSGVQSLLQLAVFLLIGYAGLKLIESGRASMVAFLVPAIILLYVWLKKYSFLPAPFLHISYSTLGLSYAFFRYSSPVGRRQQWCPAGPGPEPVYIVLSYTLNFSPSLLAQFNATRSSTTLCIRPAALLSSMPVRRSRRIALGFFKTNVMAALVFPYSGPGAQSSLSTFADLVEPRSARRHSYCVVSLFLYCNFSGYIDVVIGIRA